jgi:hypothetical protein
MCSAARVRLFTLVSAKVLRVHDWQVWLLRDLHHHMERRPKPLRLNPAYATGPTEELPNS